MTGFVDNIFTSMGMLAALVVAAVWIARRPQSRAARRAALAAAFVYGVSSVYAVPQTVAWIFFTRAYRPFAAADTPAGRTAVVVLGGGAKTVYGWGNSTLAAPSGDGLERVLEAARVFSLTRAEWLIASGGRLDDRQELDAITMRDELVRIGVPAARIVVESNSRTTHEQAVFVSPLLGPLGAERVVLVTSDIHMLRSLAAFRAQGVSAVPAIAPATHDSDPLFDRFRPTDIGLMRSQQLAHEVFGVAYYTVRGWCRFGKA